MKTVRIVLTLLVVAAAVLAVLAGLGTGDSFESTSGLWGDPDTAVVQSGE